MFWTQTQLGLPKLTQNYGSHGKDKWDHMTSHAYQKTLKNFYGIFFKCLVTTLGINTAKHS